MIYYLLPHNYANPYKELDFILLKELDPNFPPILSESLYMYLFEIKEKIHKYSVEWDNYKKYTNPYEYIHTNVPYRMGAGTGIMENQTKIWNGVVSVDYKKKPISKYRPLSRSYFKMIEIYSSFQFDFGKLPIQTFHLAEGPGGFIEALSHIRKNPNDKYVGMTLIETTETKQDPTIPGWKKSQGFLKNNPNVFIETGEDKTGNILNIHNFVYCKEKYGSSIDFITADGGFDFSTDFQNQELNIGKLLFAQIAFAICMQKRGGTFVLKIFDSFMAHTADLLYLLASFYKKTYITKPNTSRFANSEKYIVCTGFIPNSNNVFYPNLVVAFHKMLDSKEKEDVPFRFLKNKADGQSPISHYFLMKLEEYNSIFGQQQIENIYATLSLIENQDIKNRNNKIDELVQTNIQKSIDWCMKYGISI